MPLEKTIERAIRKAAEAGGWLTIKMHGGPMSRAGLPDLLCVRNGEVRWIEVKQPKGHATPLQLATMLKLNHQGTPAQVCRSVDDAVAFLAGDNETRRAVSPAVASMERRSMEAKRGSHSPGRRTQAGT